MANAYGAKLSRALHPLRCQRWIFSDLNPALWWLRPAAEAVKAQRQAVAADHPGRNVEATVSELTNASLDLYRATRDALAEAAFFQIYGNLYASDLGGERAGDKAIAPTPDTRQLSFVKEALASIDKGGYPEALAPDLPPDQARRIGGVQEIIARYEPEKAVETLPSLLRERNDRIRLVTLLERVLADERVQRIEPSPEQKAMLTRIRAVLGDRMGRAVSAPPKRLRLNGPRAKGAEASPEQRPLE